MISVPTTFVIGAGASKCVHLPVSSDLVKELHTLSPRDGLFQVLTHVFDGDQLQDVLKDIRNYRWKSIDAFIEHRHAQHAQSVDVGKGLLAGLMGQSLCKCDFGIVHADDWLGEIVEFMADGVPTSREFVARNARVTFVTFNFDLFIETQLNTLLRKIYRRDDDEDVRRAIDSIRIVHIHGKLAMPPQEAMDFPTGAVNGNWINWIKESWPLVHVTNDEITNDITEAATSAIRDCLVLCFLGFAFDKNNLAKLGVPRVLHNHTGLSVFGSAFKMSQADCARAGLRLNPRSIELGKDSETCLDVLRRFPILRD